MGAFLEKPVTEKHHDAATLPNGLSYALSSMQGWRIHMEDAHAVSADLPNLPNGALFAVFDGHGGKTVSTTAGEIFIQAITSTEAYTKGDKSAANLEQVLSKGLFELDEAIKEKHPQLKAGHDRSGSTVICGFVTETSVVLCNCGDSRAVLVSDGKVKFATSDHKPSDEIETQRIKNAGGFIEMGRVCGNLAVSRAIGDYEYKDRPDLKPEEQKVTALSDTTSISRTPKDEFLVLACDGIWDVLTNEGVQLVVNFFLERGYDAERIADLLLDYCLELGSKDNMSALLILFPGCRKPDPSLTKTAETEEARATILEEQMMRLRQIVESTPNVLPAGAIETSPMAASKASQMSSGTV